MRINNTITTESIKITDIKSGDYIIEISEDRGVFMSREGVVDKITNYQGTIYAYSSGSSIITSSTNDPIEILRVDEDSKILLGLDQDKIYIKKIPGDTSEVHALVFDKRTGEWSATWIDTDILGLPDLEVREDLDLNSVFDVFDEGALHGLEEYSPKGYKTDQRESLRAGHIMENEAKNAAYIMEDGIIYKYVMIRSWDRKVTFHRQTVMEIPDNLAIRTTTFDDLFSERVQGTTQYLQDTKSKTVYRVEKNSVTSCTVINGVGTHTLTDLRKLYKIRLKNNLVEI